MDDITIATPFVRETLLGARERGYDINAILAGVGIPPSLIEHDRGRVPLTAFVALMRHLMHLLDDEGLGLTKMRVPRGGFELITRSAILEPRLPLAMTRYAQGATVLTPALVNTVEQQGPLTYYALQRRSDLGARSIYIFESAVMTAHRFFCWLTRHRIPLMRVEFDYPEPSWATEYKYLFYNADILFDRPRMQLVMRTEDLQLDTRQSLASLNRYLRRAPRDVFTPMQSDSISQRAREHVLRCLDANQGLPDQVATATALGMSKQTFWRRMRLEGTDYTRIRSQARRDRAIVLLRDGDLPVERIAEALGFSESSAFIRAFKGWTGMTPLAFRRA